MVVCLKDTTSPAPTRTKPVPPLQGDVPTLVRDKDNVESSLAPWQSLCCGCLSTTDVCVAMAPLPGQVSALQKMCRAEDRIGSGAVPRLFVQKVRLPAVLRRGCGVCSCKADAQ